MIAEERSLRAHVRGILRDELAIDPSAPRDRDGITEAVADRLLAEVLASPSDVRVALISFVRDVYDQMRSASRVSANAIEATRKARPEQAALPGWQELLEWRAAVDDATEIAVAYASIEQLTVLIDRYGKLSRENEVKRQYLVALREAMRQIGAKTVTEFYAGRAA